jgi:preprotein translocase subunit YajC
MKALIVIVLLAAAGFGFYFLIYRPRKAAESKAALQTSVISKIALLRGAPLAA